MRGYTHPAGRTRPEAAVNKAHVEHGHVDGSERAHDCRLVAKRQDEATKRAVLIDWLL